MAKGYEELIQEVLVKHGVALGDQDPILVLHTINRKLADDLSSSLEEALTDLKQELEQLYFRWEVESKSKAERILAAATAAAKDHLETRATELSASTATSVAEASSAAARRLERTAGRLLWIATGAMVAVCAAATSLILAGLCPAS